MCKRFLLAILLAQLSTVFAGAQNLRITGKVIDDSSNTGLANVSVVVAETKKGVSTDSEGNFVINVTGRSSVTLSVSYVGYRPTTQKADGLSPVSITLRKEQTQLDDVVVIGYQTVRRRDVLASVSSVGAKDLKDIPINSAAEALNGRLAGVTATTAEGSPDAEVRVRVRGGMSITQDNSPLYIVDGVQVENGLSSISPQDIQSIDVLKDAAATAIYGARGANGVIIITTKSGKPGKMRVTYNGLVGFKNLAKKLDVMDPYNFAVLQFERSRLLRGSDSNNYGRTFDTLQVYKNVPNIDWQEEVMGRTGLMTTHNVTLGGGDKKGTYNFGYTFNGDKAVVINSNYQRHLFNLKGDYKLTKKLKATLGTRYTNTVVYGAGVSTESSGSSFARLRNAVKYRPFLSDGQDVDEEDPLNPTSVGNGLTLTNPLRLASAEYRKKNTGALNLTGSITYTIAKNFTFKSTAGYDLTNTQDVQFYDSIAPIAISQSGSKPMIVLDTAKRTIITNSNVFTYGLKNLAKKHNIDFLLGEETYVAYNDNKGRTLVNFPAFSTKEDAFGSQSRGNVYNNPRNRETRYTNISFFGRVNYSLADKYLASFNVRADGASKFAPGRQWGYFPAGSFAWRVKREEFMRNVNFINDLKLRVGFGSVGNNRIDDYLFLTTFANNSFIYNVNGQPISAYSSNRLVNEKLKWESNINRNFGLDITLLKNRVDISVDYYLNSSKDLLLNVPIASTFGYASQLQNVGETSNKGVEVQINSTILRKKNNLTWSANFNISTNRSRIEALGYQQFFFPDRVWGVSGQPTDYIVKVGEQVGTMYGWVTDGFYKTEDFDYNQTANIGGQPTTIYTLKQGVVNNYTLSGGAVPGGIKYKDLNGDGMITEADKTIIGQGTPKFYGGLNQQLTYKNWDMSLFVNFVYGNDIYNANKIEFTNTYSANANVLDEMSGRWKTIDGAGNVIQRQTSLSLPGINNGQSTTVAYGAAPDVLAQTNARATIWQPMSGQNAFYPHSWAIEDGSFLRLNNLTIGYTLPVKAAIKMKMSRLRIYLTGNNLAILTNYTGYDPEVSIKGSAVTPGLDYSAYPKSRSFIFGVNASF